MLRRPVSLRKLILGCACSLFLAAGAYLRAASFDCAKAQRTVEKVICGDPALNAADDSLGRVYRAALSKLPENGVGQLRADQVQWLAWVQQICQAGDTSRAPRTVAHCMQPVYADRIKFLRTAVFRSEGITFLTRTQYIAAPEPTADAVGVPDFPGFGTLQASWPEAMDGPSTWSAWNHAVELQAYPDEEGREKAGKPGQRVPALRWTPDLAAGQDSDLALRLKSVEHARVTVTVSWDSMGHGAAHPNESFSTMTWLLSQQRLLRAEDVFKPGSAWQAKVAAICWAQILKQGQDAVYPEVKGPDAKALLDDIADVSNWTLETDGLHISYPEYSISPRAAPVDDAVIPWRLLRTVLDQNFVSP